MDRLNQLEEFARRGMNTQAALDELKRQADEIVGGEDAIPDLAKALGVEPTEISDFKEGDGGGTFTCEGIEYRFFNSEDTAHDVALSQVRDDLSSEPEMFNQDWLQSYMTISETDRRIIASEEADNLVDEVYDQDELIEKAGVAEEYAAAEKAENTALMETIADNAKEKVRDEVSDDIESRLADPIQYFVHDQGIYSVEDLMKQSFIMIDIDAAAESAIDTDGWAHFLSHYDGEYETTDGGLVYFREN